MIFVNGEPKNIGEVLNINNKVNKISNEQMQREVDYARAQGILKSMLKEGHISLSEFNKITALNRESFSPMFAEIMP